MGGTRTAEEVARSAAISRRWARNGRRSCACSPDAQEPEVPCLYHFAGYSDHDRRIWLDFLGISLSQRWDRNSDRRRYRDVDTDRV
jgi:hypothetical protein